MDNKYKAIKERIINLYPESGVYKTGIKGLTVARRNNPTELKRCFYHPTCIIPVGGEKSIVFGSDSFSYKPGEYVVSCTEVPVLGRVVTASPEEPCVVVILTLDSYEISKLIVETRLYGSPEKEGKYLASADVDDSLLDSFYRLVDLLEQPESEREVLSQIIMKEIYYRILTGPLGNQIRLINTRGTQSNQISEAINIFKNNYKDKINIEDIAQNVNMVPSSFYRNFKRITKISPLQYLKQLRLYEAQRLMLSEGYDAASVSYMVGYESPTQFSREYKKLFGEPPLRNIRQLAAV